jgi:methionine aminotransferase
LIQLISKLPNTGTTIFTKMSAMAAEAGAINLSQGFPDFDVDRALINRVAHHMRKGANQYAPMAGAPVLREKLAEKTQKLYGHKVDSDSEITITAGATQAIFSAIQAVVRSEDEVIIFEPAYDCYAPAIRLAGGEPIRVQLEYPGFAYNWDAVRSRVSARTRMIIINSPHNPTGTAISDQDMAQLQKITEGTDIIILSDEVYEHILFDGFGHQSVLRYPDLAERAFAVFSFGKTYHVTGWKMGYIIAPEALMKQFRLVHQFEVFSVNHPMQLAMADYLEDATKWQELNAFYEEKRNYFISLLKESKFKIIPSKGTYFQLLDYSEISEEQDEKYAELLTWNHGVASIPISVFYRNKDDNKVLRFCFAKSDKTLEKAAEKLCEI